MKHVLLIGLFLGACSIPVPEAHEQKRAEEPVQTIKPGAQLAPDTAVLPELGDGDGDEQPAELPAEDASAPVEQDAGTPRAQPDAGDSPTVADAGAQEPPEDADAGTGEPLPEPEADAGTGLPQEPGPDEPSCDDLDPCSVDISAIDGCHHSYLREVFAASTPSEVWLRAERDTSLKGFEICLITEDFQHIKYSEYCVKLDRYTLPAGELLSNTWTHAPAGRYLRQMTLRPQGSDVICDYISNGYVVDRDLQADAIHQSQWENKATSTLSPIAGSRFLCSDPESNESLSRWAGCEICPLTEASDDAQSWARWGVCE